jgi:hypothetical protein
MNIIYQNNIGGQMLNGANTYTAHITKAFVDGVCVGWAVARTYAESDAMAQKMVADRFGVAR